MPNLFLIDYQKIMSYKGNFNDYYLVTLCTLLKPDSMLNLINLAMHDSNLSKLW